MVEKYLVIGFCHCRDIFPINQPLEGTAFKPDTRIVSSLDQHGWFESIHTHKWDQHLIQPPENVKIMILRKLTSFIPNVHLRPFSIDLPTYHRLADHALECLYDSIDRLIEEHPAAKDGFDSTLAMGVLTVRLGKQGTVVVNKQPPNLQLWLSSPISGPKRYNYDTASSSWVYKRDGSSLTDLLSKELSHIFQREVNLTITPINTK